MSHIDSRNAARRLLEFIGNREVRCQAAKLIPGLVRLELPSAGCERPSRTAKSVRGLRREVQSTSRHR
eukprot:331089-Prymnesium_polylepis.2